MSNQNYLSYIHSYKYNEVTTEPKWKKKDRLSYKNGPHATISMMNGDTYFGEWKDNLKHGIFLYIYIEDKNKIFAINLLKCKNYFNNIYKRSWNL